MKRLAYLIILVFISQQLFSQLPEDAIRMSWTVPSGTARQQAIGGAMGSLGGEMSSLFVNPAGLGFYKTSEFVLSPGISFLNGKSNYRGIGASAESESKFNLGTTGFVFGQSVPNSRWNSKSFSIGINRIANFNGRTTYHGENDFSSFSESFAEEFSNAGIPIDVVLYTAPLSLATKLANYTYLIDTLTVNGQTQVVGLPERDAIINGTDAHLFQENNIDTKGGITEISFGFAGNMDDKLYLGGSFGVPIVNYERTSTFTETDMSGDPNNNFNTVTYTENYRSQGVGINAKLGMIIKPVDQFRAGLAIHTPTIYGLKEVTTGNMVADLEDYLKTGPISTASADSIYTQFGADIPQYRYDLYSPWKFIVSGSYMINAVEDVTKQRGFITADIEYVTHRSSRFRSADENADVDYYKGINDAIKFSYKNAFNFRVGGEMKFNTFMARLGYAYYGNPYEDKQLKAHKMNVSGGLGYRNKGIFADVTYVYGFNRDVNFPYRLSDKANTFADVKNNNSNVMLTVGVKF
jgi:hypothetical protein